jgi:hypothetical protein
MDEIVNNTSLSKNSKKNQMFFLGGFIFIMLLFFASPNTITQIVAFLILSLLGVIFLKRKSHLLFFSFFFVSIIISRLLVFEFILQNGTYFIGGGDDELFNELGNNLAKNQLNIEDPVFLAMPYKLYLYLLGFWIKLISIFNTNSLKSNFHYELLMLNSFFGALVTINVKKILLEIEVLTHLSFWHRLFVLFNPFVVYFSSVLLREIVLVYFITTALIFTISDKNILIKVTILLLCFISAFLIRPASSILILIPILIALYLKIKSSASKAVLIISFVSLMFFYFIPNLDLILGKDVGMVQANLLEMVSDQSQVNSFGSKLIQSNNVFSKILVPFYVLISPIPPPIIGDFSIRSLLISLGAILWYLTVIIYIPFLYSYLVKRRYRKISNPNYNLFVVVTMCLLIFNTLMVGYGSLDPRHHLLLYSIITPIAFAGFNISEFSKFKFYYFGVLLFIIFFSLAYLLIKISL